jgi:hypothetical protein
MLTLCKAGDYLQVCTNIYSLHAVSTVTVNCVSKLTSFIYSFGIKAFATLRETVSHFGAIM